MNLHISRTRTAARVSCTLLWLLGELFLATAFAQAPNAEFQHQLQVAQQRYQAGDLDGAIAAYQQASRLNPQSGLAYSGLGSALLDQGNPKDSVSALEQAIALLDKPAAAVPGSPELRRVADPLNLAVTLNNLALAYYQLNRFDEAFARADRAVQIQPSLSNCWNTRGMVLEIEGKLDDAIVSYRKAVGISPKSANMSHNLGEALQKKGQLDEATVVLQQGLGFHPSDAELLAAYGNALAAKERFAEAAAAYQKSLAATPDVPAALYGLGFALRFQGKYPEALKALLRAHEMVPDDADTTLGLSSLYAEMGRYEEAAPLIQSMASTNGGNPLYLLLQADTMINGKKRSYHPLEQSRSSQ